jgi:hypothetical protein
MNGTLRTLVMLYCLGGPVGAVTLDLAKAEVRLHRVPFVPEQLVLEPLLVTNSSDKPMVVSWVEGCSCGCVFWVEFPTVVEVRHEFELPPNGCAAGRILVIGEGLSQECVRHTTVYYRRQDEAFTRLRWVTMQLVPVPAAQAQVVPGVVLRYNGGAAYATLELPPGFGAANLDKDFVFNAWTVAKEGRFLSLRPGGTVPPFNFLDYQRWCRGKDTYWLLGIFGTPTDSNGKRTVLAQAVLRRRLKDGEPLELSGVTVPAAPPGGRWWPVDPGVSVTAAGGLVLTPDRSFSGWTVSPVSLVVWGRDASGLPVKALEVVVPFVD